MAYFHPLIFLSRFWPQNVSQSLNSVIRVRVRVRVRIRIRVRIRLELWCKVYFKVIPYNDKYCAPPISSCSHCTVTGQ